MGMCSPAKKCILIELMHSLQGHFVDQKTKHQKKQKNTKNKTKYQKTKKPILAPTMAGILWYFVVFCFLVFWSKEMVRNKFQMLRNICGA